MSEFNPQQGCPASFKLFGHVLQKGFEAGGLIGGFAVVPATAAYTTYVKKGKVDPLELAQNAAFSCLAGVGLSALMGSIKILQMDREGVEDRVYRLHYNNSQKRTDTFSLVGAVLGIAATGYLLKDNSAVKPLHFLGGAGVGAASGVLLHMMTRPLDQKTANKMMHELRN
jgi:hypothetical protein